MKKRILALALACTTAFSVFGAAMSANAAWWDSTHVTANDDAYYRSYTPAGAMHWDVEHSGTDTVKIVDSFYFAGDQRDFDRNNGVISGSDVYTAPWSKGGSYYDGLTIKNADGKGDIYNYDADNSNYKYFTSYEDFAKSIGYTNYTATEQNGQAWGQVDDDYVIAVNSDGEYYMFPVETWNEKYGSDSKYWENNAPTADAPYKNQGVTGEFFLKKGSGFNNDGGQRVLTAEEAKNEYTNLKGTYFMVDDGEDATSNDDILTNMLFFKKVGSTTLATVYTGNAQTNGDIWFDYGDNHKDLNSVEADFEAVMAEPVETDGTVYLYDYYNNLPNSLDMDDVAYAWAHDNLAEVLSKANKDATSGQIDPDTGYRSKGIREDVMYAWEDFLDNLGISDASNKGLTAWAEATLQNYIYKYNDSDAGFSIKVGPNDEWTITWTTNKDVDLYNFEDLIEDIMYYAPADKAEDAQTSQLVYLMQQYNKFVGEGFVDEKPVETDNWGDLLVSLAQAPTEDEFRTGAAYRRYTNKVEDLVEQYEEAETSVAVSMAEEALYDFVTSYTSSYTYSTKVDTASLATAIDNTVFNYDWRKSYDTNNAADVYVGHVDTDGYLDKVPASNIVDKDLGKDLKNGQAWALYPQDDYTGNVYGGNYPGVDTAINGVTAEYQWFLNVYDLAYNVYTSNKYQSTVDLMATTLNEAVAALTPDSTSTARASDILGAEEANDELESLVDTDYTTDMWANRNKINTYINDRVSNDEIGRVGSNNAEDIAELVDQHLGLQRNQTVVTRSDINNVSAAKTNAETALKALQDDEDKYNAAQANALEKAIDDCQYIIDIYNGDYSKSAKSQSVNAEANTRVGDKDQILKSDCTNAIQAVDDAINFKNVIMGWTDTDEGWKYGVNDADGPHYLNDGWHQVDGGKTWFYFDENGVAKESTWWQDPATGTWYYFNQNCGAAVGWAKVDGNWYYFKGNNAMKTGWEKVEGSWYYMDASGKMVTGWCQINGTWYYFSKESNALGQMLANTTTPDGYKVDANGALVE